jgi:hypothetical protein
VTRRAIIGNISGSIYGLKVSRPGYDVVTCDPDDPAQTSFYSEWTDIVRAIDVGYASSNTTGYTDYAVTDPGYIPWMEARQVSGSTVYDERTPFTWGIGPGQTLDGLDIVARRGLIRVGGPTSGLPVPYTILYVIFNVAVPSQ